MTAKDFLYDVIIVGAGPVGLSLGISLAEKDLQVLILEKEPATVEHSRAPSIWPATQEILARLGVIENFREKAIELPVLEVWDADKHRKILSMPLEELKSYTTYPELLILPQAQTEKILLRKVKEHVGIEILFSSELIRLRQSGSLVTVTYRKNGKDISTSAKIVAGADGAHSKVREEIKATFRGRTYPFKAALADVEIKNTQGLPFPRISTRSGPAIGIRISEDVWRIILPFLQDEQRSLAARVEQAVNKLFGDCEWRTVWQSDFSLHKKVSSTFAEGRVVLAGDAAHLNSPVGGQGMNAGIQDIFRLREAILRALKENSSSPLGEYSEIRKKEIREGVNKFTDSLTKLLLVYGKGRLIKPVFWIASLLMRFKPARIRILKRLAMLK